MSKNDRKSEERSATAAGAYIRFRNALAGAPSQMIDNATLGIGKHRLLVGDKDLMPDWVQFPMLLGKGTPLSCEHIAEALDHIDDDGLEALLEAILICGLNGERSLHKSLKLLRCRQIFEPAFRASISMQFSAT